MKHKFINELGYGITVTCKSTILAKPLIVFDVAAGNDFEWDQNEGTSFTMTVNETSSGNRIFNSTKVDRAKEITFTLSAAGSPMFVW